MRKLTALTALSLASPLTFAGPWGNDFGLSYNPTAGALGAATYARPQSASDAVFGNPATTVQLDEDPRTVTIGAAYANIDFRFSHNGAVTGNAFDAKSSTQDFLIPNVAFVNELGNGYFVGAGLQITAGLGSDFRTDTPLSPAISYIAFGNNFTIGKKINENWSVGASAIMGFGLIEVGPVQSAGTVNDIALRGSLGVSYDDDLVSFSLHYTSSMEFDFENAFLVTGTEFGDLPLEQPEEFVLGFAWSINDYLEYHAAVLYKGWGDASGYEDIWENQTIFANGLEIKNGSWAYRLGFGFTSDLRKENLGSTFAGNTSLGFGGQTIPLNPVVTEFLQASLAPSFWTHHLSAGVGYKFKEVTQVDFFIATVMGDEEEISEFNQTDVDIVQFGAGLTWRF